MIFATTPSQTVGPYLAIGLPFPAGPFVVPEDAPGAIRIRGHVYDGDGEPIPDGLVETWQADAEGRFADLHGYGETSRLQGFRGFGRSGTGDEYGSYEIVTVKPGRVPGPNRNLQAPHIDVSVFARGLLNRCVTRIYFADERAGNAEDEILNTVPEPRRETLLAQPIDGGYQFDIRLQGPGETVFFDI